MPRAGELLRQGRNEELWQMCCGFLKLNTSDFMSIQRRLLEEQLHLLNNSEMGRRMLGSARPRTVEEFRRQVPITAYKDYCPQLLEKDETGLPAKPDMWVRTSGRSGEYKCRWIPMTPDFAQELSIIMYGIGMIAGCNKWNDDLNIPKFPRMVYSVAPRPYMTGAMTTILAKQQPVRHLPDLDDAEELSFEDRIKLGFKMALSEGIDYFFGMSMVLVTIGEKFSQPAGNLDYRQLLSQPKALLRLAKGMAKSKLARRPMLPRDLWKVKGIMSSGLDSWVYRDKIKDYWGRYPLDVYATTEGGIIATQLWDYDSMVFIPNLNFLEFIPEEENLKWQMDPSYQPQTLLLDEVEAGKKYELIITNFHGGPLMRYRIGDMVRITSLRNEKLGIAVPQMTFERRADGVINFVVVQLTEKQIWQAIEKIGLPYADWTAYKKPGESVLHVLVEPKSDDARGLEPEIAAALREQIIKANAASNGITGVLDDLTEMFDFQVEVTLLPSQTYAGYMARKQAEGADLAHIKPPHLNPSEEVLAQLLGETEETIVVTRRRAAAAKEAADDNVIAV